MVDAWKKYFDEAPVLISYEDLLKDFKILDTINPSLIRIESPGENQGVREWLIQYGADNMSRNYQTSFSQPSQIGGSIAWYKGYCSLLDSIKRKFPETPWMNSSGDIQILFNKPLCRHHLQQHQVSVPPSLGKVDNLSELLHEMHRQKWQGVFIKPSHGSSASGVIALRAQGNRIHALTSAKREGNMAFNSLALQQYSNYSQVAELISILSHENLYAEKWIPKLMRNDLYTDFRVMVIGGTICHIIPRMSAFPITNLHLGNKKGNWEVIKKTLSQSTIGQMESECKKVSGAFPNALYLGIDIMIDKKEENVFVLEVNAFGDLLPDALWEGKTTWETECYFLKKSNM